MMPKTLLCTAAIGLATAAFAQADIPKSGSLVPVVRQQTNTRLFVSSGTGPLVQVWADRSLPRNGFLTGSVFNYQGNTYLSFGGNQWGFRSNGSGAGFGLGVTQGLGDDEVTVYEGSMEFLNRLDKRLFVDFRGAAFYAGGDWGHDGTVQFFRSVASYKEESSGRFIGVGESWWFAGLSHIGFDGRNGYDFFTGSLGFKKSVGRIKSYAQRRLSQGDSSDSTILVPSYIWTFAGSFGPHDRSLTELTGGLTWTYERGRSFIGLNLSSRGRIGISWAKSL